MNRRNDPYGASPRFGSAYLRLQPEIIERAIFCWPDSVYDPRAIGGPDKLDELCRLADAGLLDLSLLPGSAADLPLDDPLNDYVEAHVHGGLIISRDVEALVLDPTDRQAHAEVLDRLGCLALRRGDGTVAAGGQPRRWWPARRGQRARQQLTACRTTRTRPRPPGQARTGCGGGPFGRSTRRDGRPGVHPEPQSGMSARASIA